MVKQSIQFFKTLKSQLDGDKHVMDDVTVDQAKMTLSDKAGQIKLTITTTISFTYKEVDKHGDYVVLS